MARVLNFRIHARSSFPGCMVRYAKRDEECLVFVNKRIDDGHCYGVVFRQICAISGIDPDSTAFYDLRTPLHDPGSAEPYWLRRLFLCVEHSKDGAIYSVASSKEGEWCSAALLDLFLRDVPSVRQAWAAPIQIPAQQGRPYSEIFLPN
ncbi:MAG: hypothetical protein Q8P78_02875 [bacterium]|nr:hypothetical protein [bacterium]